MNLLDILAVLIGLSAAAKWFLIWRAVNSRRGGSSSATTAVLEVAGYVMVIGLVVRVLGV
jgi:hypothetical protein